VEAMKHKEWQQAMVDEYDSVIANGTWKLVDCPIDVKPIDCKWVYKSSIKQMVRWISIKKDLWQRVLLKKKA
jgi:hypothetical protein